MGRTVGRADVDKVVVNPHRVRVAGSHAAVVHLVPVPVASLLAATAQAVALYPCCIAPADVVASYSLLPQAGLR